MKKPLFLGIYLFAFLILPRLSYSQLKTEYYPNGNKYFEGKYVIAWSDVEPEDQLSDPQEPNNTGSSFNDIDQAFFIFMNPFPERKYEGACTFYYQNGKKWFQGNYQYGVKQGKFQYWYASGQLAMERYYKNGMADGNWKAWDKSGKITASYSYKAISDSLLKVMNQAAWGKKKESENAQKEDRETIQKMHILTIRLFEIPSTFDGFTLANRSRMKEFGKYIKDNLFKRTIWDGAFKVWNEHKLLMEFEYTDNVRSGTWKLYENGKLAFSVQFHNGNAINPIDYNLPQQQPNDADTLQTRSSTVNPIDKNSDTGSKKEVIYRNVEVQPQFKGDINQYIRTNTKYPKEALKNNIQGKVYVSFVILKTGQIDTSSIEIMRGLGYGINEEAIRIVKSIPVLKPAKLNGKAVNMYYSLSINFSLQ